MIKVTETYDSERHRHVYEVIVPDDDLKIIYLDHFDKLTLAEPMESAADILQNLQILAFRQQQQAEAPEKGNTTDGTTT